MAKARSYPRSKWISEIPFDVAIWGDKPDPYAGGLFKDEKDRRDAEARAADLPKSPPRPK